MGWKAFNLIATNVEEAYLTTFPSPDSKIARSFVDRLGGTYKSHGEATFENGLYPQDEGDLYVGAYANAP